MDIFEFWSRIGDGDFRHPADAKVFDRVRHKFERDCLPAAYTGPLRTAPVVLLFLSPGYTKYDADHATTEEGRAYYRKQRTGLASLPLAGEHPPAWKWWSKVVAGLDWAQGVLFPQAEAGERVVVCLRSSRTWGLGNEERRHGVSLFVPPCAPNGMMHRGEFRLEVEAAVRRALGA